MRALSVAIAILVAAAHPAGAEPKNARGRDALVARLREVEVHMTELRYAEARAAAEGALALGAARPGEVARIARALGEIGAALDDPATAERWFLLWLALNPTADLPAGSSPKLTAPLAAARARMTAPLAARATVDSTRVLVAISGDPAGYVASAEVTLVDRGGRRTTSTHAPPITIDTAGRTIARAEVSVRDGYGNELVASMGQGPRPRARPFYARPWPYLVVAGVAAGAGGVLVWRREVARDELAAIIDDSENHTFEDAEAVRHRAERYGWAAVGAFAAAGVLGATAMVLALRDDDAPTERSIAIVPASGGAILVGKSAF